MRKASESHPGSDLSGSFPSACCCDRKGPDYFLVGVPRHAVVFMEGREWSLHFVSLSLWDHASISPEWVLFYQCNLMWPPQNVGVSPAKELCSSTCLYFCKMLSCLIHENNLCSSPQFTDEETVTHRAEVIFRRPTETTGRADAENESSRDKPAKGPPLLFYTTKVKIRCT